MNSKRRGSKHEWGQATNWFEGFENWISEHTGHRCILLCAIATGPPAGSSYAY